MKRTKKIQTEVKRLPDEVLCMLVTISMHQFERHLMSPDAVVRILVYAVMHLHANAYEATRDKKGRESVVAHGRELAPIVTEVLTSDRPDEAVMTTRDRF